MNCSSGFARGGGHGRYVLTAANFGERQFLHVSIPNNTPVFVFRKKNVNIFL